MSTQITRDEWLQALSDAGMADIDDREAITTTEWMAMFGGDRNTAKRKLDKLVAAGKATRTTKRERTADGRWVKCVGYRLKP